MNSVYRIWWIALIIKALVAFTFPIVPDESYYWVWSHFLDFSYFDHPAMVAWLFALSKDLAPLGSIVRWPFLLIGHLSLLFIFDIAKTYLSLEKQKLFALVLCLSPMFTFASFIATPDSPFIFFWCCSLWMLNRGLQTSQKKYYIGLGVALGLGFCSKYMIVLFIPSLGIALISHEVRNRIKWNYVVFTFLAGLICSLPVIYWNYQHDFVSFNFQLNHGLGREWEPKWTLGYLLSQALIAFPIFIYLAFKKIETKNLLWISFSLVPFAFFFFTSFKGFVEPNWALMAYPALYLVAIMQAKNLKPIRVVLALWSCLILITLSQAYFEWIPSQGLKKALAKTKIFDLIEQDARSQNKIPVYLSSYQMASIISFRENRIFKKLPGLNRKDFFDFLPLDEPFPNRFIIYVEYDFKLPEMYQKMGFSILEERIVDSRFKAIIVSRHE